ncbi:MAG: DNA/pantothenate metabolism flavoprotein [Verrucomicrobia bacterium]|nr:DNA/pantothenate metabolism flavoprotein [Verrucomicrobiota bacterium]
MKILLTSGATREPIDAVRFVSNVSTGSTGAALADALARAGHEVTLLHGEGAVRPCAEGVVCGVFTSTENLGERLRAVLGGGTFDAVIQAAAVSDYRPEVAHGGKLTSHADELVVRMVPTPKLLPQLKSWSPQPLRVLGFKLTHGADEAARATAVGRVFAAGGVDAVVHNDLREMGVAGAGRTFRIYRIGDSAASAHLAGVGSLSGWVDHWLGGA